MKPRGDTRSRARIVGLAFLTVGIGTQLATPLLPSYGRELGLGVADLSAVYSIFLISAAAREQG